MTAPTECRREDVLVRARRTGRLPGPVRLALEADSRAWQSGRDDVQRNSAKQNLLVTRGWRVLCFTWFDATRRPEYVVAAVASQLAA